jgi:hypothetical protein
VGAGVSGPSGLGSTVGEAVGDSIGDRDGENVGVRVGESVGRDLWLLVGWREGPAVGLATEPGVGSVVGL